MRRAILLLLLLLPLPAVAADEVYYEIPLDGIVKGDFVRELEWFRWHSRSRQAAFFPRVVLRDGGEAYVSWPEDRPLEGKIHVCRPVAGRFLGILLVPGRQDAEMRSIPFSVDPEKTKPVGPEGFLAARKEHCRFLLRTGATGSAWFRHMAGGGPVETNRNRWRRRRESELAETYSMITGGRAVSENLSLEQVIASAVTDKNATVDLASIEGITVAAHEWKTLIGDAKPALDTLAALVPADQHALFFPSFKSMTDLLDEADEHGTPVLRWFEAAVVDSRTREKYERQLLLGLSELARTLGPHLVESVVMTGSDMYLRTGTDVAIVFEAKNAQVLDGMLKANRRMNLGEPGDAEEKEARIGRTFVDAILSPDRTVCSYQARVGANAVVVTNSLTQLKNLIDTSAGTRPSLATLDEYRYFRKEYPKDEPESAFLMITDATLRRWCGPKWRIAASRRTRAAALMAEAICWEIEGKAPPPGWSEEYGRFGFLTPIAEMDFTTVTEAERDGYLEWKRGYERNWKQFYDPIAARVHVTPTSMSLDVTVLPLKTDTDYAQMMELAGDSKIRAGAGDPHDDALIHMIMAIDRKSRPMREIGSFTLGMTGNRRLSILDWIGETVSIYVDDGPYFDGIEKADDPEKYIEKKGLRIPIALRVDVRNALKFAGFIMAVRSMAAVSAPLLFETVNYKERVYTKVTEKRDPSIQIDPPPVEFEVFYTSWSGTFLVTLDEDVMKRAIDRDLARKEMVAKDTEGGTKDLPPPRPWLGEAMAVRVNSEFLKHFEHIAGRQFRKQMRDRSFSNLPILNEWKRMFPDDDPADVHQRFFGIRPVCPGGGVYRWNRAFMTMESTVFGHPASPKEGPGLPDVLKRVTEGEFGLTFHDGGVRAKCEISRKPPAK